MSIAFSAEEHARYEKELLEAAKDSARAIRLIGLLGVLLSVALLYSHVVLMCWPYAALSICRISLPSPILNIVTMTGFIFFILSPGLSLFAGAAGLEIILYASDWSKRVHVLKQSQVAVTRTFFPRMGLSTSIDRPHMPHIHLSTKDLIYLALLLVLAYGAVYGISLTYSSIFSLQIDFSRGGVAQVLGLESAVTLFALLFAFILARALAHPYAD